MHHKRRHPRRKVRCRMCTDARFGNSQGKHAGGGPWRQRAEDRQRFELAEAAEFSADSP